MSTPGIVTPEAVRLEFDGANIGSRSLALLVDLLAQALVLTLLLVAQAALVDGIGAALPGWAGIVVTLLLVFVVVWGYPVAFETLWRGRTPGKAALGLRVVTVEGAPVRFRHAAIRALLALVDIYASAGGVAVLSVLCSSRQQRVGDLVAGTLVLREGRAGAAMTPVRFTVPPGAERYAGTVDPGGLTVQDYARVRQFLLRAEGLRPEARARLSADLARVVARRLVHVPPPEIAPEVFLTVVAARYQQRGAAADSARSAPRGPAAPSAPENFTPPENFKAPENFEAPENFKFGG